MLIFVEIKYCQESGHPPKKISKYATVGTSTKTPKQKISLYVFDK
jgi:hypothetical protein